MKRMKALLGVVLAIALVLSLSLTAFATGSIVILNPPASVTSYNAYQIFTAAVDGTDTNKVNYTATNWLNNTITVSNEIKAKLNSTVPADVTAGEAAVTALFTAKETAAADAVPVGSSDTTTPLFGITQISKDAAFYSEDGTSYRLYGIDQSTGKVDIFEDLEVAADGSIKKLTGYSAAEFANWLAKIGVNKAAAVFPAQEIKKDPTTDTANQYYDTYHKDVAPGYYWVIPDNYGTGSNTASMLTTVLEGKEIGIHNKNDMPFEKDVSATVGGDSIDNQGVKLGDVLHYTITTKVPAAPSEDSAVPFTIFYITDKMSEGLEFDPDSLKVEIEGENDGAPYQVTLTTDPFKEAPDDMYPLVGDYYRMGRNGYTFELSIDVSTTDRKALEGNTIKVTYDATVTEAAITGILDNYANLSYTDENGVVVNKDDSTRNYMSRIIVDKFETGEPEQKLAGAKFKLYKLNGATKEYYKLVAATATVPAHVEWVTDGTEDEKVTDVDGAVEFDYLPDGTYYLEETVPPTGYAPLAAPIEIVIDGSDSTDTTLTDAQRELILMNVSHVANTPGSVLPSTGGRGTTMLYMAGLGMMLAAGAFLIFRRRAEAGK